jgi:hypothetical protein
LIIRTSNLNYQYSIQRVSLEKGFAPCDTLLLATVVLESSEEKTTCGTDSKYDHVAFWVDHHHDRRKKHYG